MTNRGEMLATGIHALQSGLPAEAVEILSAMATVDPKNPDVLHHLGSALFALGELEVAVDKLRDAGRVAPERADIANDLGVVLHRAGAFEEAEVALRRAVELSPGNSQFHHSLGFLLADCGDKSGAEAAYRACLKLNDGHASAHNNLGNILKDRRKGDAAAASYEAAITADPDFAPAYKNLADLQELQGDWTSARNLYGRCVAQRDDGGARVRRAMALPVIAQSTDEIDRARMQMAAELTALAASPPKISDPLREVGGTPFFTAYHGYNDRELHELLAKLLSQACPMLNYVAPHCDGWSGPKDKIRIGFASAFFYNHTIAKLNRGLIAHLPRDEFEVELFSLAAGDAATNPLRHFADRFTVLPRNLALARAVIAKAELDILYYTDIGMDPVTYSLAFARLAPVQCTTWGHPDTTGIPSIDYFVSSQLVETVDAEAAYSETLVRLAPLVNYVERPHLPKPVTKDALGLPEEITHFVCPQSLFKFHPDFDQILGAILRADRRAGLLLIQGPYRQWAERLRTRLARTIPDAIDQIRFLPRLTSDKYLELLAVADVVLDTPHFCGGMTSYEALACGAPVVTLPSQYARGRVSLGLYRQLAIEDLIADSSDDYAELATRLIADRQFNLEMRERISETAPLLFDNREAVNSHARFFKWAVDKPKDLPPVF